MFGLIWAGRFLFLILLLGGLPLRFRRYARVAFIRESRLSRGGFSLRQTAGTRIIGTSRGDGIDPDAVAK